MKKNFKFALFALVFCALMAFAGAENISIAANASMEKGQMLEMHGSCARLAFVALSATSSDGKKIFENEIQCTSAGDFSYIYGTSFLDPAGEWVLAAESAGEKAETSISVLEKPESQFYLITFLSPSATEYKRTDDIIISVKVTDSGKAVDDANVIAWGVEGKRIQLYGNGNGNYSTTYGLPFDAELGEWVLTVAADKKSESLYAGGENSISLAVAKARIIIDALEPSLETYQLSEPIPLKASAVYSSGKKLAGAGEKPKITARIGENEVLLQQVDENFFAGSYEPRGEDFGEIAIVFSATDEAGNTGETLKTVITTNYWGWFLKNNLLFFVVAIVLAVLLARFFYSGAKYSIMGSRLKNEKTQTEELIKSLQREYFEKGVMPAGTYKENLSKLKAKLTELDARIADMEALEEKKKKKKKGLV
ncbi:MAG: hypothetical protein V1494_01640 [Candidatus Diapherotrites archaeon]